MHTSILPLLCCPDCKSSIKLKESQNQEEVLNGKLNCVSCGSIFDISNGIPIFTSDKNIQEKEKKMRDTVTNSATNLNKTEIMDIVKRHHYIRVMRKESEAFADEFSKSSWIVDIGCGWAWHWDQINNPNIICVDFSFYNLLIARKLLMDQVDKNIHLVCADATNLPFNNNIAEGLWSVQTFQHLNPNILRIAFSEANRILNEKKVNIYWLNYALSSKLVRWLFRKEYKREVENKFYLKRLEGRDLKGLVSEYFNVQQITIGYNEVIFNPDLRITHNFNMLFIDELFSKIPLLNKLLARQVFVVARGK